MDLSIIIPCFNEGQNVVNITQRISAALSDPALHYEIIFVDDSTDNTPAILKKLSESNERVHHIHRTQARGLGTAVVEGFHRAKGKLLIVMDADLQHPPEVLPELLKKLQSNDIVIPSRFIKGGSDGGLNSFRKLVSWTARKIGQFSIKRFRSITDCTSGFFGLNRDVIHNITLNPDSWKILMEILVKGKYKTVGEIPYHFMARDLGDSKMSSKEQLHYLWHIIKLICVSPQDRRFYLFCFVGVLGVFINLLAFHLFLKIPLHPLLASVYASAIAIVHNFLWHDNLTWKDHKHVLKLKRAWQFSKFILVSCVGIVITAGVVKCFLEFKLNLLFGQLSGIALCTFWSYFANHTWTWKKK